MNRTCQHPSSIAVVGLACWYPGAKTLLQFWENILSQRRQFRQIPNVRLSLSDYYHSERTAVDKTFGRRAAVIDGFEFDWASHRIPLSTYKSTDIVQWLALEVALSTIGNAGYTKQTIPREKTGVIVGNSLTGEITRARTMRLRWPYVKKALSAAAESLKLPDHQVYAIKDALRAYYLSPFPVTNEDSLAGGLSNTIAGRICNYLSLYGGGFTIDGACSSSLLAVSSAANGLVSGDLDFALAGGVDVSLDPFELVGFAKAGALTEKDMNVYDRRGAGFIPGEGCGFIALKRMEDARKDGNYVYAVIQGWGISSDGGGTGIIAPSAKGQSRALCRAYAKAPYEMNEITFIEGHGTGTTVGDRTELEGIILALGDSSHQLGNALRPFGVTSLKSIIGHTKAASGVGGLIKAIMAVNRRVVPPTAACSEPHAFFDTGAKPLYPVRKGRVVSKKDSIRAGVSAMGFGGINCHVTLESADPPHHELEPGLSEQVLMVSKQETEIFVFSGESMDVLSKKVEQLSGLVEGLSIAELTDLGFKLGSETESKAKCRCAVIAEDPELLLERLKKLQQKIKAEPLERNQYWCDSSRMVWIGNHVEKKRVGMLFPGQGSQKIGMAEVLTRRFKWAAKMLETADKVTTIVNETPLSQIIYRPLDRASGPDVIDDWFNTLSLTQNAQPAICFASVVWNRFLNDLGIYPVAVGGHSLGELTGFHVAGAFDFETLIRLAAVRGRAMAIPGTKAGAMVSLACSREVAEAIVKKVDGYVVLANINAPSQTVLSGESFAIEKTIEIAGEMDVQARLLKVSNAFHSKLAAAATEEIRAQNFLPKRLGRLDMPLFSSVTGKQIDPGISIKDHFAEQVLSKVDFISMVSNMAESCDIFIEVGPGRVLSGLSAGITGDDGPECMPVESDPMMDKDLNKTLAALFVKGQDIHWDKFYDQRLVRPFSPASDKIFIKNPCEKLLTPKTEDDVVPAASGAFEKMVSDLAQIPQDHLSSYLEARAPFLAQIILADLKYSIPGGLPEELLPKANELPGALEIEKVSAESGKVSKETLAEMLLSLVAKNTGFPTDSLTLNMRLLDDLNMDSIKAGDLIVKAAKEAGLSDRIEPVGFANASLSEILDKFMEAMGDIKQIQSSETPFSEEKVLQTMVKQASMLTGFPKETLDPDALLERDLSISAEMLKKLLQQSAALLKIDVHVDLEPLRKRSLRQVAEIITRIGRNDAVDFTEKETIDFLLGEEKEEPWVREFRVDPIKSLREPPPDWWGKRREDDLQYMNSLILFAPDTTEKAEALKAALFKRGATVRTADYEEAARKGYVSDPKYSLLIAVLPVDPLEWDQLEHLNMIVKMLASISAPPPAAMAPRRRTTVAYIQLSRGNFGKDYHGSHFNSCIATALAKSLHLERRDLRIRVLDFSMATRIERMAEMALDEINTPAPFAAVGYDVLLNRYVMKSKLLQPSQYQPRKGISWSKADVILVTGGAKGITASIALGVAKATGVRMVLIGSSPPPKKDTESSSDHQILKTLKKYAALGLEANYFACDITRSEKVLAVVEQIRQDIGPITGIIHGAGLNYPRSANQVTVAEVFSEVSPKLLGAVNLMKAVSDNPPKIFSALTSVIGLTGMPGNSWYGFSNEALRFLMRRFKTLYPHTHFLAVAYSIWRDEGMGARMGSISMLKNRGIEAIPTHQGVDRFVNLFLNDPKSLEVVVSARMSGLDTWEMEPLEAPENLRFTEKCIAETPGVEATFKTHLSLNRDPYLKDHLFNGSYLFPTVFGLEAMAQVSAYASGIKDFSRVKIKDICLERPITVDPETGADIIIHALVAEKRADDPSVTVHAGIVKSGTGDRKSCFAATFVLGLSDPAPQNPVTLPETPLPINPSLDLYKQNFLFQGPRFQRIENVWKIKAGPDKNSGEQALFTVRFETGACATDTTFPDSAHKTLLLGDPFFRDSLLQSAYLLVPKETCLPYMIRSLDIFKKPENPPAFVIAQVFLNRMEGAEIEDMVMAMDTDGRVIERLEGYVLKSLRHNKTFPTAGDLAEPDDRDNRLINQALDKLSKEMPLSFPKVGLTNVTGLHGLPADVRRQKELPLIRRVVNRAVDNFDSNSKDIEINWSDSGKPLVSGLKKEKIGVSISHDDRLCFCISGRGDQGCDILPVSSRSRREWEDLLGEKLHRLMDELIDKKDSLNMAGTRLWALKEAYFKAYGSDLDFVQISAREKAAVLFDGNTKEHGIFHILTIPLNLTRGSERILALTVDRFQEDVASAKKDDLLGYEILCDKPSTRVLPGAGPQGQMVMAHRFPVTFRPSAQLSRKVYFSNYFFWAGEAREISALPVLGKLADQFSSGKCGGVTNFAHLKVLGEATTNDIIEVRMWSSGNGGPKNSTMDLTYEFRKIAKDENRPPERLAWLEQQTTWVKILDHGVVEIESYPEYYMNFAKAMLPVYDVPSKSERLPEPLSALYEIPEDEIQYSAPPGPGVRPVLFEYLAETSLEDSNLVGNIYFANYYAWQGQARDRYFYKIIPEYFRGVGKNGELVCLETRVDHLREAMPFDRIVVTIALKEWRRFGATFSFEYFKLNSDATRLKLGYGEHKAVWVTRDSHGQAVPVAFPEKVKKAFAAAVKNMEH